MAALPPTPEIEKRLAAWAKTKPAEDFLGWLTSMGLFVCRMITVDQTRCGVCGHLEEDHLIEEGTCLDCVGQPGFVHEFESMLLVEPRFTPLRERPDRLVCRWQGVDADACAAELRKLAESLGKEAD